jgi:AcrR family transcriptional regulator
MSAPLQSAPLQSVPGPGAPVGRPRDVSRDRAVLQAVRELLAEEGYQALSVHKVTRRCGVHVRTIARRWDTKAEMVAAAILGGDAPLYSENPPGLPTGRLRDDLRELIDRNLKYLADPANQAALPALMSEIDANDRVREHFERREEEWIAAIRSVLERAVESGDAPKRVLGRERLLARVLAGTTHSLQFTPTRVKDDDMAADLANFVLAALLAAEPMANA